MKITSINVFNAELYKMQVNVSGVIIYKDKNVSKTGRTFKIRCPGMNQTFTLIYDDIAHGNLIRKGDSMFARCIYENNILTVESTPYVCPPEDKWTIIEYFKIWRFKNTNDAKDFYDSLVFWVMSDKDNNESEVANVIDYLDSRSQSWNDYHNPSTLEGPTFSHDALKDILTSWHKERNIRKLKLLYLSYNDIDNCPMSAKKMYEICLINPYRINLSKTKCERILKIINRHVSDDELYKSDISQYIDLLINRHGWTCVPSKFIIQKYPNISDYFNDLCKDYGIHYEYSMLYSRLTYTVENYVTNYIVDKVVNNNKENGDIEICTWENNNLSDDQKYSVELAINNNLSIINGGAGCGKCLHPRTEVLLANGEIIMAKDIMIGDILMSPMAKNGQEVTSICSGVDKMFRICSENGEEFICNSVHVLTLVGKEPYIIDNDVYITKKGIPEKVVFESNSEARQFISNYKKDIYDISLDVFLSLPKDIRECSYLISGEVNFPYRPVPPFKYSSNGIGKKYLYNSRVIRMGVLSKIIKDGMIKYENSIMKEDIKYLCRSLGFIVKDVKDVNEHNGYLVIEQNRPLKFTIEEVGEGRYNGFTLNGDGRFMLGNFIITHNTTCIREIVENLRDRDVKYALCAFTGKAVSRLREVTGQRDAFTIHRLINNATKNLTQYDHIIVDEASMLTTELFYKFIRIYSNIKRITLVGDTNQLQPIGWGMLFNSILKSETVPTCTLSTNYRVYTANGERDGIILNANLIVNHEHEYPFEFVYTQNFSVISGSLQGVYDILKGCKNANITPSQIVILSPFNEYIDLLNGKFQEIYRLSEEYQSVEAGGKKWIVGDRVMAIENDEDTGIFNGETGIVDSIEDDKIKVKFGNMYFDFMFDPTSSRSVNKLKHAYALSIDKSQGSEWDFVIIAIPKLPTSKFINKNRMYTAITRTKRCCWIITENVDSLQDIITRSPPYRCDNLSKRLSEKLPAIRPHITSSSSTSTLSMDTSTSISNDEDGYEFDDTYDCDDD